MTIAGSGPTDPVEPVPTVDDHGARVQRMFSSIAHGYDRANRWMSLGTDRAWRRRAVAGLLPEDAPPAPHVLDLCAGTLDSTLEIARQHPNASIVAGDFSAKMLEHGRRKLDAAEARRVKTVPMDAHAIPLADGWADAVFCAFGVRNLSDLPRAMAEVRRVLRPGGLLTVLEFFRPESWIARSVHGLYNRTVLPLVGWAATGRLDPYLYLPRSIGAFARVDDYLDLLRDTGLEPAERTPLTMEIAWIVRARKPEVEP
ncbi:MAG: ubiquinone/menaquinone biosynthesis methyltransferase [Deltaproteobacteria bacterium]|nr:MAG: ubiquinone/menaquinone biosynthesis methyltransferase [Deltaproteobacteria bacterium]